MTRRLVFKVGGSAFVKAAAVLLASIVLLTQDTFNIFEVEGKGLLQQFYLDPPAFGRFTGATIPDKTAWLKRPARLPILLSAATVGSVPIRRIHGLMLALDGQWDAARQVFRELALDLPKNAAIQNDLGVAEMGTAASDATAWLRAIEQFKLASAAQPDLPEPRFNAILVYRQLGLTQLEKEALADYRRLRMPSSWDVLLPATDDARVTETNSPSARAATMEQQELSAFVKAHPEEARSVVMEYARHPVQPVPQNYVLIAKNLSQLHEDQTAQLALAPLGTADFEKIASARNLVEEGRSLYFRGRLNESHETYVKARASFGRIDSMFDRLWIDVNDADTLVRTGDYSSAAAALTHVAELSRALHLPWMQARALSVFGSTPNLSPRFLDMLSRLEEALQIYHRIEERRESARPLYYLAGYSYVAGSLEDSLRFSLESLQAADPTDYIRLSQLHWLLSGILDRMGYAEFAAAFNNQASYYAELAGNPGLVAVMRTQLASLYLSGNRPKEAADQINNVEQAVQQIPSDDNRAAIQASANLMRAQISLATGAFDAAEEALRENVAFFSTNRSFNATHIHSQSRLFLAKTLRAEGRVNDAADEFRTAIDLVEQDQTYLSKLDLQIAFDRERRDLYQSAVAFEYRYGGCDKAWNLIQSYKAKLFLDLLGKFTPALPRMNQPKLSVSDVQARLPETVEVLEYAVLDDQLLAWVISKDNFACRAVSISKHELERTVSSFLKQLSVRGESNKYSEQLYDLLVDPVDALLDSKRTLVVVPDAALHRVPLASLRSRKDGRYWLEKMAILESPSINFLFSAEDSRPAPLAYTAFGSRTYDMFINKELAAVRAIEPAVQVHVGPDVTKEGFLRAMQGSSLVYYAGHSALDVKEPLRAAILLDGDRPGPNSVAALDIVEQRMSPDGVVILSSCETSIGNSTDGPGIRGLTSAFLVAGAASVVGSLWPVESSSTTMLMPMLFETFLKQNRSMAESLREAQLHMLRDPSFSHPYYWSGFVVTGNLRGAVQWKPSAASQTN